MPTFSDAVNKVQFVNPAENLPRGKSYRTDDRFFV